jgi:prevent-host-death family protein
MVANEPMPEISISEFKATCLAVLHRVKRTGQSILVTRRGEPIAQVTPPPPMARPQSWLGCMAGTATIVGDVISPATEESDWEALLP